MPVPLSLWRPHAFFMAGGRLRARARARGAEPEVGGSGGRPRRPGTRRSETLGHVVGKSHLRQYPPACSCWEPGGAGACPIPLPPSFRKINELFPSSYRRLGTGSVWWRFGRRQPGPCESRPEEERRPFLGFLESSSMRVGTHCFFFFLSPGICLVFGVNPPVSISVSNTPIR